MSIKNYKDTIFVLDTNILIIDANSIYAYPKATILIPISVVEELDNFKRKINGASGHTRNLMRDLDNLRQKGSFKEGIKLSNSAVLKIWLDNCVHKDITNSLDIHRGSNKVLSSALNIKEFYKPLRLILVSNDTSLRLRASMYDIETTSYQEDKLTSNNLYEKLTRFKASNQELAELKEFGHLSLDNIKHDYHANQNVAIEEQENIICRYTKRSNYLKLVSNFEDGVWGVVPRNFGQKAALDILLDKTIDIVMLIGKAGTGKTLLALAAALYNVAQNESLKKILVARPIVPLGNDIGYLPGDIEEKITPWMKPIFDNLEFLTGRNYKRTNRLGTVSQMISRGLLELEALTYIRGRSIPNRFMIVDEAQNLTPHEIKTIITRIGYNTKIVLTGDPYQIDNPYVDSNSNGLTYITEKFKPYESAAHVNLMKGERSNLAELASNVL